MVGTMDRLTFIPITLAIYITLSKT
jgi:hypothetical protein